MPAKSIMLLAAAGISLSLSACQNEAKSSAEATLTPQPTATVIHVVEVPTPAPSSGPTTVEVMQKATPCGSEKLVNYLNLLPTKTAKEEIAKSLGHNRIRYVGLEEAKASASAESSRLTAGIGADGRIKVFNCG